jgi:hypothetical protein
LRGDAAKPGAARTHGTTKKGRNVVAAKLAEEREIGIKAKFNAH